MTAREAVVTLESGATAALRRGANDLGVVCLHPWGPLGGSRDDPHVLTAANFFAGKGCHTCRVDFRSNGILGHALGYCRGDGQQPRNTRGAGKLAQRQGIDDTF